MVKSITYDSTLGCSATTTNGVTYTSDYIVVTLPLGVLQSNAVSFAPALPATKNTALGRLGMGTLNKLWMEFPSAFWLTGVDHFNVIPPVTNKQYFTETFNIYAYSGKPVLLLFNAGSFAVTIERWSDAAILANATSVLKKIYGSAYVPYSKYVISRWKSDPYAMGSYSYRYMLHLCLLVPLPSSARHPSIFSNLHLIPLIQTNHITSPM